jgi:nucleoside-diphosphate-sugar epimerase
MRVLIAGATGVIGRRVVSRLLSGNHAVVGLARSEENERLLRACGAEPRRGDLFRLDDVRAAAAGCDAVLHLATAIPTRARSTRADWALNDRIQREGTRNLVDAAARGGARLYIQQSVLFVYGDRKGEQVDEASPIASRLAPILESAKDMEEIVHGASGNGLATVILRFGTFYSYDAAHTRMAFDMARKNRSVVVGRGTNYTNLIHLDDAADAVVLALENEGTLEGDVVNVCDDEPATARAVTEFITEELKGRSPRNLPVFLAKLLLGPHLIGAVTASVRCSNRKAKERLGFRPTYPTYREGYRAELQKWRQSLSSRPAAVAES